MVMLARLRQSIWAKQCEVIKYFRASQNKRWQRRRMLVEPLEPRFLLSADLPLAPSQEFYQDPLLEVDVQALVAVQEVAVNIEEIAPEQTANDDVFVDGKKSIVEPIATIENATPVPLTGMDAALVLSKSIGTQVVIIDRGVEDIDSLLKDILPASNSNIDVVLYEDDGPRWLNKANQEVTDSDDKNLQQDKTTDAVTAVELTKTEQTTPRNTSPENKPQRIDIYFIDTSEDGVDRVSEILSQYENLAAVHLLSHGNRGQLMLGNSTLTTKRLQDSREQVAAWGQSLRAGGDILLYGCDVADGDIGLEFIEQLSKITLADVAASTDDTGGTAAGGDWVLEASTGVIETSALFTSATDYDAVLANFNVEGNSSKNIFAIGRNNINGSGGEIKIDDVVKSSTVFNSSDFISINAAGADDIFKFSNLPDAKSFKLDGGKGTDTLDFSSVNKELFITVKGKGNVTVEEVIRNSSKVITGYNTILSAKNIESIKGSRLADTFFLTAKSALAGNIAGMAGDDTFIFAAGASVKGNLDGGAGKNTLAYSYKEVKGKPNVKAELDKKFFGSKDGGYKIAVKVDLEAKTATGVTKNVTKIQTVVGARKDKIIFSGTDTAETILLKQGNNEITAGGGNDIINSKFNTDKDIFIFKDGWGKDVIEDIADSENILDFSAVTGNLKFSIKDNTANGVTVVNSANTSDSIFGVDTGAAGVKGVAEIRGGLGENIYAFENKWNSNTIINDKKSTAAKGTLDFSAVTSDLIFKITAKGKVLVTTSVTVNDVTTKYKVTATGIANITGGKGNNTYLFEKSGSIKGSLIGGAAGQTADKINTLNYASYGENINANLTNNNVTFSNVVVNPVRLGDASAVGVLPNKEQWVYSIDGLKGSIALVTGTPATEINFSDTNTNEIDEQKFKNVLKDLIGRSDFTVNKTVDTATSTTRFTIIFSEAQSVMFTSATTVEDVFNKKIQILDGDFSIDLSAVITAQDSNKTQKISLAKKANNGVFKLSYDSTLLATVTVGDSTDYNTIATTIKTKLDAIASITSSYDVTVNYEASAADAFAWDISFTLKAGVVDPAELKKINSEATTAITYTKVLDKPTRAANDIGKDAIDEVWLIYNNASGGDFKLKVETLDFQNVSGANVSITTDKIDFNASPDEIQKALQDKIRAEFKSNAALDVEPLILVSGMGTKDFSWQVTFANLGKVKLTVESAALTAIADLAKHSATAIGDGITNTVKKITNVVGSGKSLDRLYATEQTTALLKEFSWSDITFSVDKQAIILSGQINLQTGQAVLFKKLDTTVIPGLDSSVIYYVSVSYDAGLDKTSIQFFANNDEIAKLDNSFFNKANAIELAATASPTGTDKFQLRSVAQAEGGKGSDTLFAPIGNAASALFGNKGDDVLVGSNGSDYIDGGAGNDVIYGDGSTNAAVTEGEDIILGGAGNDKIYGNTGTDNIRGGSGNDFLVGGAGSDIVDGGSGDDTLAIIERGLSKDYNQFIGGNGDDEYRFEGEWGVTSLKEKSGFSSGSDTINLSSTTDNSIFILSNGSFFSTYGVVEDNQIILDGSEVNAAGEKIIEKLNLKSSLSSLTGSQSSSGQVLTEWGFSLFQVATENGNNASLKAFDKVSTTARVAEQKFRLWIDRGNSPDVYEVTIPAATYTATATAQKAWEAALLLATGAANATDMQNDFGLSVVLNNGKLEIIATADGTLDNSNKIVAARAELMVNAANAVVVGGENNFENFEQIKLGAGANTFVFGNDYWGGGSGAASLAQAVPLVDVIARNLQGSLTVDTSEVVANDSPLVLDFRSVNQELYFNFSKVVKEGIEYTELTVRTVRNLTIPLVGIGPEIRNNTMVFTLLDKNTTIFGGRYKNTFNFDKGATFQGNLVGGEGGGPLTNFAGRYTDKILEVTNAIESVGTGLSVAELIDSLFFQVDNSLSYSNFGKVSNAKDIVTTVNMETLRGEPLGPNQRLAQTIGGNWAGPIFDKLSTKITGLSGLVQNTQDANLGDVFVRSGINFVRGTDYDIRDVKDFKSNPSALLTSGGDTINIGKNPFSIAPGFNVFAGGSGADTYAFNTQLWGGALIIDDIYSPGLSLGSVGDAIVDAIVPQDTLDFSNVYQDLYYTVVDVSLNDIEAIQNWSKEKGLPGDEFIIDLGTTVVLVSGFNPFGEDSSADFSIGNVLTQQGGFGVGDLNIAIAIGVENISGGRGKNEVYFYDGAEVGGRIAPGFGGSLTLNYSEYNKVISSGNGISTELDIIDKTIFPQAFFTDELPGWAQSLFPSIEYTYGRATGSGGGALGIVEGGDIIGSDADDNIIANKSDSVIDAGAGNDTVYGRAGKDEISGGTGDDKLYGEADNDELDGGAGKDTLDGGIGDDILVAGDGDDTVIGGIGTDIYRIGMKTRATDLLVLYDSATGSSSGEIDRVSGVEQTELLDSFLPVNATFITNTSNPQTFYLNPTQMTAAGNLGTYTFNLNNLDIIDLKGYAAAKVDFGTYTPADAALGTVSQQTLIIYADSNWTASSTPILTLLINGLGSEITANNLNFSAATPLLADTSFNAATTSYQLLEQDLLAIREEATARWLAATNNDPAVKTYLENLVFSISDLEGSKLAQVFNNTVRIDIDAAGSGWFIDATPQSNEEYTLSSQSGLSLADADSDAYANYDLLSVLMHEMGHALGLEHSVQTGTVMDKELRAGARAMIQLSDASQITFETVQDAFNDASALSDEEKILGGLDAFASWADDMSFGDLSGIKLPFITDGLDALWDTTGIASALGAGIRSSVLSVFDTANTAGSAVTTDELLALSSVSAAQSNRLSEFEASVNISNNTRMFNLADGMDFLKDLGLNLDPGNLGITVSQSEDLQLEITLDLLFGFGLDGSSRDFYVENPTLRAGIKLTHNDPLDVSLSLGPIGVGIEDATIFFEAGVLLPTEGRFAVAELNSGLAFGLPTFDASSSYEINLPFKLQGALAGLSDNIGSLSGSFNTAANPSATAKDLSVAQFFNLIPQTLNFDGDGFGSLLDLSNVSLDAALEGIKTALQSAISSDGAAYTKLPFINKSAVELLGNGSTDIVQAIIDGIEVVQANLSDINKLEIDLNQEINTRLDLGKNIGGNEVDNAYDNLVVLSTSLTSQSSNADIAIAIAEQSFSTSFINLKLDRDVVAASERLAAIGLDSTATDLQIAESLADPVLLADLKADRDLMSANSRFVDAISRLAKYGFSGETGDVAIDAFFDTTDSQTIAQENKDVLLDAAATADQKQAAQILLARLGIVVNDPNDAVAITAIDLNALFDRSTEINNAKADRDLVSSANVIVSDAYNRLQQQGLGTNVSDLSIATAIVGSATLQDSYDDRNLLNDSGLIINDATNRLTTAALSSASSDADIALSLIDSVIYNLRLADRDILSTYESNKFIDLAYKDSVLDLSFGFNTVINDDYDLALDLADLPGLGDLLTGNDILTVDLSSNGKVRVDADVDIELDFIFDLSSLGSPAMLLKDNSGVTFNKFTIETLAPIDIEGKLTLLPALGGDALSLTLAIDDADIFADLTGSISLVEDPTDNAYNISELADSSIWNVDLIGSVEANLPMYFPTASIPMGGTTADFNGDGYADNLLRIDGEFRGTNDYDLNFITPNLNFADAFNVFAILNDPAKVLQGLEGMFSGLKSTFGEKFQALNLPLLGDALKDAPDFLDNIRDALLSAKDAAGFYTGGLGKALQDEALKPEDTRRSTIQLIQEGIYNTLGPGGLDILSAPKMVENPYTGKMEAVYGIDGKVETVEILSPDDIQLIIEAGNLQFNIIIADEVFPKQTVGLNFGASLPGFDLNSDAGLEVTMDYVFGLGFGFGADGFYVDTTGISDTGSEFALDLDAGLTGGIDAKLFFFEASLEDYTGTDRDGNIFGSGDDDGLSGFNGSFDIDLKDSNGDGKWVIVGPNPDSLSIEALLSASLNVDLYAKATLPAIDLGALGLGDLKLELPAIETVIRYDQVLAEAVLGTDGVKFDIGGDPELSFEDVTIDAGDFITNVLGPLINPINTIIEPIKPLIDLLTQEIAFLSTVGATDINTIQKMIEAIPDPRAQTISRIIKAVIALSEIIGELSDFATAGKINLGNFDIDLGGSSSSSTGSGSTGSGSTAPKKATAKQTKEDNSQQTKDAKQKRDNLKNKKSIKDAGDFQLTLLEDPFSAIGLLLGQDDVTIFKYVFPDVAFNLDFGKTVPVFPGLNAGLFGEFSINTDITIGFDSRGLAQFLDEDFADPLVLFNGFFLDDNFVNGVDMPELTFGATIGATASVGIGGLVEAGIQGGIRGELNFDFNDVIDDGKFYADEFLSRIIDPKCLFDINGSVSAFLDAFFWVGVDLGFFGKATLYEYRKNFVNEVLASFNYSCPPPETFDIASLDNGNLNLRYLDGNGQNNSEGRNYSVEVVDELNLNSLWRYGAELAPDGSRDDVNEILFKDINGRDLRNLSGPQIIVKAGGVVEVFDADKVNSISGSGSSAKDSFVFRGSIFDYINNIDINAAAGDDTINLINATGGTIANITLRGGSGNDTILGSQFADTIYAGSGSDIIYGNDGDDTIYGVELNSSANGANTADRIVGGAGNDTIRSGSGNDIIYGDFENKDDKDKSKTRLDGVDSIYAGAGNDTVIAGGGADNVWGDSGNDVVLGGDGNDILRGGTGNDTLYGQAGNDLIYGVTENSNANSVATRSSDSLYGGAGDDSIYGGDGSDFISGGTGLTLGDILFGDDGSDTFDWQIGDGLDFINGGKVGQTGISNTFNDKLVAQGYRRDGSGNIFDEGSLDTVTLSGLGDDVRIDWQSSLSDATTLDLIGLRALSIDTGDGADKLRFNDLRNTTLTNANSNGTIIPAVTVSLGSKRSIVSQEKDARDANGNLTGSKSTFNTLKKLDDNQSDSIEILGEGGVDEFILTSKLQLDPETGNNAKVLDVVQTGGVTFRIQEVSFNKDQLIIDTGAGDDTVDASAVGIDVFNDLRLLGGDGDDRLIGTKFSELLIGGSGADRITGGTGVDIFQSDEYASDITREYDANGKVIIDTLIEQRDANFTISDTKLTIANSSLSEDEDLNNVFEAFEFTGGDSVNTFKLTNWSGNGFMNGLDGSDAYIVNLSQSAEGANFININDTGTDGKDSLNYFGSSEADLIQLDTVYQQTKDPERQFKNDRWLDYGSYGRRTDGAIGGDGLLIAHFGAALAGYTAKDIDDTDALFEIGVSSLLASTNFQVLNYSTVEDVTVYGSGGDDVFISDDTEATLNLYGNEGDDQFYIGSILEVEDVLVEGQEITVAIEVTQGTSYEMNIFGGDDDDYFEVSHNAADINLYGDNGDDTFFIKALLTLDEDGNTFDLVGKGTNVNAGKLDQSDNDTREVDIDSLVYVENANVNIDGGAGFDSVAVVGTALSDTFYIWAEELANGDVAQRIFGAGIKLNQLINIERLVLLTGAGDDRVYINGVDLGPNSDMVVNLGTGSDEVYVGSDSFEFSLNFPKQNAIEFSTLTGYERGQSYNTWGRTIYDVATKELIVPYTIRKPATTEKRLLPEMRSVDSIKSPLTIIGGLGQVDKLIINNENGPQSLEFSNTILLKKQIQTNDTVISFPAVSVVTNGLTDLLNQSVADNTPQVKEILSDFLRNQVLFEDKYRDTNLINELQAMSDDSTRDITLAKDISYAVFQDTLVPDPTPDAPDAKKILTAREQLAEFLTGTGYSASYTPYTIPGSEGQEVYYELTSISNTAGEQLAFESQNKTLTINDLPRRNMIGVSLITAAESIFTIGAGYIENVELADKTPTALNTLSIENQSNNIFFEGFDEVNLSLNVDAENVMLIDNTLFDGILTVAGGELKDTFTVYANNAQTFLNGNGGNDDYSIGNGTLEAITAELFLIGGAGDDSVVVNSESLNSNANVLFEKTYLEIKSSQTKLNRITSLIGVGDTNSTGINATENELIVEKLRQLTASDIQLVGAADFAQFELTVKLAAQSYASDLRVLFANAEVTFEDDIARLVEDTVNAYLDGVDIDVTLYQTLITRQSSLEALAIYREKLETLVANVLTASSAKDSAGVNLGDSLIAEYGTNYTTIATDIDTLLADYLNADTLRGDLRQNKIDGFNSELTTLIDSYTAASQAVSDLLSEFSAEGASFTEIINSMQTVLDTYNSDKLAFENQIGTLGSYLTTAVNDDINAQLALYLANTDGTVSASSIKDLASVQTALVNQQTGFEGQLTILADDYKAAADAAALDAALQAVNTQLATLGSSLTTAVSDDVKAQLDLYRANTDATITVDSVINVASLQNALVAKKLAFENNTTLLASAYKLANTALVDLEQTYATSSVGGTSLQEIITNLETRSATLESDVVTTKTVLDNRLNTIFTAFYTTATDTDFEAALTDYVAGTVTITSVLDALNSAYTAQASVYDATLIDLLTVYQQTTNALTRAELLVSKDVLSLSDVQAELQTVSMTDTELEQWLEDVRDNKLAEKDALSNLAVQDDFIIETQNDLVDYISTELGVTKLWSDYQAIVSQTNKTVEVIVTELIAQIDADNATELAQLTTEGSRDNFERSLSGLVSSYKAAVDSRSGIVEEIAAYVTTSSEVSALVQTVIADIIDVKASLLSKNNIDVDDYLSSGLSLRDYLGNDNIGGVNSAVESVANFIRPWLKTIMDGIEKLDYEDQLLRLAENYKLVVGVDARDTALQAIKDHLAILGSNLSAAEQDDLLAQLELYRADTLGNVSQASLLSIVQTAINNSGFSVMDIASLNTAIQEFSAFVNNIDDTISAEHDIIKSFALALMPALDLQSIQNNLDDMQAVLSYQDNNAAVFIIADKVSSASSFAEVQALYTDTVSGDRDKLLNLIVAYKDAQTLAKLFGLAKAQELSTLSGTLESMQRLNVYANFLPLAGTLDIQTIFNDYNANLKKYDDIANTASRLDAIKTKAKADALLASLEKDKIEVDLVIQDNRAFEVYYSKLNSYYFWFRYWAKYFLGASKAITDGARAQQATLNSEIVTQRAARDTAVDALEITDAQLDTINKELVDQYQIIKALGPVILDVLSATRSGNELKALLDADSSLIATIQSYSNEYAVVQERGDNVNDDPIFEGEGFSTVTSRVNSVNYDTSLLALTGLNSKGIYSDYDSIEQLTLNTGAGDDTVDVYDSLGQADSMVQINTGDGDDSIRVGNELNTVDGVVASVLIDAGKGSNALAIDDSDDQTDNGDTVVQQYADDGYLLLTGLADGNILYKADQGDFSKGLSIATSEGDDDVTIAALFGNDLTEVFGSEGDDVIRVIDFLVDPAARLTLYGDEGNDLIDATLSPLAVTVYGRDGNDTVFGSRFNDTLYGDAGDDTLMGNNGNDTLYGGTGNDDLFGNNGDDTLYGEDGDDALIGSAGKDTLYGGTGDDILFGDYGLFERTNGQFTSAAVDKPTEGDDDQLFGGDGDDLLIGGVAEDSLFGNAGSDVMFGDSGRMYFLPTGQQVFESDFLFSGADDFLNGGSESDYMFGGFGSDTFVGSLTNDAIFGEYGRVTLTNKVGEFVLRLGQGNLDVITSTMFGLYLPQALSAQVFNVGGLLSSIGGIIPTLFGGNIASANAAPASHDDTLSASATDTFGDILVQNPPAAPPVTTTPVEPPVIDSPVQDIPVDVIPVQPPQNSTEKDCRFEKGKRLNVGDVWSKLWAEEGYDKFVENIDELIDVIRGKEVSLPGVEKCTEPQSKSDMQNNDELLGAVAAGMLGWQVSKSNSKKPEEDKDISLFAMLREKSKKSRFIRWN